MSVEGAVGPENQKQEGKETWLERNAEQMLDWAFVGEKKCYDGAVLNGGKCSQVVEAWMENYKNAVPTPSKLQIRGALPKGRFDPELFRGLIGEILSQLRIPCDETYEALFFKASGAVQMSQLVDRQGNIDRLVCTVPWKQDGSEEKGRNASL